MKLGDVGLVAAKELRETLRDRRTLMVMVLFPLVVYPLVSLLMAQLVATRVARGDAHPSRVAVRGDPAAAAGLRARLEPDPKSFDVRAAGRAGEAEIESDALDAVVVASGPGPGSETASVRVIYDETRETSSRARDRITQVLGEALPAGCAPVYKLDPHSIAPQARVGGYVLSKILPLIVVVMVMLGAFYPAIDITAGERERGTLETILSAPIRRFDLMAGKVLAVATLAAVTGILNMASMSLTMLEGVKLVGAQNAIGIPWTRAAATLLVVFPTAFLFASVMVAIGSMARSFKEAQTLLTPVYFLCFTPSLVAGLGDYDLAGAVALVPGVNVTLLARDLIVGKASAGVIAAVVLSTLGYGALALRLAARLYDSERLLAADDRNLRLGAWLRRLFARGPRPPSAGPNPGQAIALFGVAYVLLFFVFIPLQAWRLEAGLILTEWVGLLGLVAVYARVSGQTFASAIRLRRPSARALVGAALIGLSAWAVVGLLAEWIFPVPEELLERLRHAVVPPDRSRGLAATILLMALTPAVCEEALFRGPILRGFAVQFSPLATAVLTGALFGLFHVDLWRLIPTGLLGVALSLVALRSGSILPSMLTHFINNACLVTLAWVGADSAAAHWSRPAKATLFVAACLVLAAGALLVRRSGPAAPRDVVV
jgi:sodium transport system permease protein